MGYVFGEMLKGFRGRAGLTQEDLANALGVTRVTVSAWERSEYLPRYRSDVLRLSEALGLSNNDTDWLLFAADYPPKFGTIDVSTLLQSPPSLESMQPPEVSGFVGRNAELAHFAERLKTSHLAAITGLAGVGKTWLAAVLARQVAEPDQVFWYAFHEGEGIDAPLWKLAGFLARRGQDDLWRMLQGTQQTGGQPPPTKVLLDYLFQMVRGRRYLLCLDDLQLVEDDPLMGQLVEMLRQAVRTGELSLIITSRHIPHFLSAPEFEELPGLSVDDTRAFLEARGMPLSKTLTTELHEQTGGNAQLLALAVEVLRRAQNPARVVAHLSEADDIERYLLREVDKSLTEKERKVMSAVAVLLGYPGTCDAIEAVLDNGSVRRILIELGSRHLLTTSDGGWGKEYTQHAILKTFYYNLLERRERRSMHQRAGEFYETEEPDPIKAARHYQKAQEHQRAAKLVTDDVWALINQGQSHTLRQLLKPFTAEQLDKEQWLAVNMARGELYGFLRESKEAQESYQEARSQLANLPDSPATRELKARACRGMGSLLEFESPDDALEWSRRGLEELAGASVLEEALLHLRIGSILFTQGNLKSAQRELQESLSLLPEEPSDWRASALGNLGVIYCSRGDLDEGKKSFEQALEIYEHFKNLWGMIGARHNLAMVTEISGDWMGAIAEYQQALEQAERLGSLTRQTDIALALGILLTNKGETEAATQYLSKALELARRHNLRAEQVHILSWLAELQIRLGEWETAEASLEEAERLAEKTGTEHQLPEIYRGWAQVQLAQEAHRAALDYAERSVNLAREMGLEPEEGMSLRVLGQVLVASGERERAMEAFEKSLALLDDYDPYEAARTKAQWGLAMVEGGDVAQGKRLLGEARATFQTLGARHDEGAVDALDVW
jgi:ATP/maltotriose-dependent transcriptional regulator MalT